MQPPQRRMPLALGPLVRTTARILANREFLTMSVAAGCNMGAVLFFIGSAPSIVLDDWHLSETQFHWLFVPVIGGFLVGAIVSGRMAGRIPTSRQVRLGYLASAVAAGCGALLHATWPGGPPVLLQQVLMGIGSLGVQLVFPVLTLRILDMFPLNRGAAASAQTFVQLLVASSMMGLLVPMLQGVLQWLTLCSALSALASLLLWTLATRSLARRGMVPSH